MKIYGSRLRADILFVLLGTIPIGIAVYLEGGGHHLASEIAKDFGVVIISLTLVDLLWLLVAGGEPLAREIENIRQLNDLTRQAHRAGLVDVADRRSELLPDNASFSTRIENSHSRIDICGYSLHVLVENQRMLTSLIRRAKHGVHVRILICSPDNAAVGHAVSPDVYSGMQAEMVTTWETLIRAHADLESDEGLRFEIRQLRNRAMTTSIFRIDDRMSVIHYMTSIFTTGSPVYVFRGSVANQYIAEFEHLFGLGESPKS